MTQPNQSELPILVVVAGRPGSGKTTLAHALAREIGCPVISRDEIKEGLVNTLENGGSLEVESKWHVYEIFFETINLLLSRSITLVAEAAFQHELWARGLDPLQKIARIRMVVCEINPQLARERFIQRGLSDSNRTRFHGDRAVHAAKDGIDLPIVDYEPPRLDVPTLTVDTSDGYDPELGEIVSFIYDPEIGESGFWV